MKREKLRELLKEFACSAYWYGEDTGDYDCSGIFEYNPNNDDPNNDIDPYCFKEIEFVLWELING